MSKAKFKPVPAAVVNGEIYPDPVNAADFLAEEKKLGRALIHGLLRSGEMAILSGESKSNKSWAALQTAVCVANGIPVIGCETEQARVMVVNTELQEATLHFRLGEVRRKLEEETGRTLDVSGVSLWNLRNAKIGPAFFSELSRVCSSVAAGLVILDPLYPLLGDRDENSNGEMAALLGEVRSYCETAGAAALITHHFAKGNSAAKAALDRGSGAGALSRFADSVLTISRHAKEDHFVLESYLRSFAPKPAVSLKWEFPILREAPSENPGALKGGRPAKVRACDIMQEFSEGMTRSQWARAVESADVAGFSTARRYIGGLIEDGEVVERDGVLYLKSGPTISFRREAA